MHVTVDETRKEEHILTINDGRFIVINIALFDTDYFTVMYNNGLFGFRSFARNSQHFASMYEGEVFVSVMGFIMSPSIRRKSQCSSGE